MTDLPEVTAQATRYVVSLLPEDDINWKFFLLCVDWRRDGYPGEGRWIVHDGHRGCDSQGLPSTEKNSAPRFDLDTALAIAKKAAPHVVVNGHTALDAYRRTHPEETTR